LAASPTAAPRGARDARPLGHPQIRRVRMMAAVARQGFDLCGVRDRPTAAVDATTERPLEPLLPGFLCASAAMTRVVDQIPALQGNDLTVLITGESGTGKELIARAIHVGLVTQRADLPALTTAPRRRASSRTASCSAIARIVHRRRLRSTRTDSHRRRRHALPR
jgi:transcriptional regulator of acetoin/glycerol metabolism